MPGKPLLPSREEALPGRAQSLTVSAKHAVSGNAMLPPFPEGMQMAIFGMGCFWGAERMFWKLPGVFSTQVGYAGGFTPNPTYKEICTGLTGHAEVVRVVYDPQKTSYEALLKAFWENHDPTQGNGCPHRAWTVMGRGHGQCHLQHWRDPPCFLPPPPVPKKKKKQGLHWAGWLQPPGGRLVGCALRGPGPELAVDRVGGEMEARAYGTCPQCRSRSVTELEINPRALESQSAALCSGPSGLPGGP
ncbi:uncharacterized protein LOC119845556 isoform X1 [Dermochelys coriacea]|uniref:uncharacterized protein LOC119845556 isoform X1 n=1 Tax=Dermochelys coriacea TaxID=27794 RepID=UPI001CA7BB5B|nr:uncharacterized protein LOC119845556 isoform X1 [Dermochelys coriacea]